MTALASSLPAAAFQPKAAREKVRAAAPSYGAFISYSHTKDKPIAAALQSVIQRLGKPWYRHRALRVFRDDTGLIVTPHLWPSIEQALGQSRFLILLASTEAATSPWVNREVAWWLDHNGIETVLIALTGGVLAWDSDAGDFHWSPQTPLPPALKGHFADEPLWIDLSDYREEATAHDAKFDDRAASFAAAIRGIPKEDLLSQELRQQRLFTRVAMSAALIFLLLLGFICWQWRQAGIASIGALSSSAKATFLSGQELEGLKTGISTGEKFSGLSWQSLWPDMELKNSVNGTVRELLHGATEHNRLEAGERVAGIAFAPDDKTIATWTLDSGILQLWKADGTPLYPPWLNEIKGVSAVAFSRDGNIAVAVGSKIGFRMLGNDGSWTVRSVDRGQINAIAFSADGRKFAAATTEIGSRNVGRVQVWNLADGSSVTLEDQGMTVQMAVALSPNGEQMVVTGWYGAFLWNTDGTKQKELVHDFKSVNTVAFSLDGMTIATGGNDKTVKLWNRDGTLVNTLYGHADTVWGLSFRPDGQVVASASNDGTVKEWQPDGILLATMAGHRDVVRAVSYSHSGKTIASASDDKTVKLWERGQTAEKPLTHDQTVYATAFSPDGNVILTTSGQGWFTLWNKDGMLLTAQEPQHGPITAVAFSRDGRVVATAASDRTVHLWSMEGVNTLSDMGLLDGQTGETDQKAIFALSFFPDGKSIVAGGMSGELQIWNTSTRHKERVIPQGKNDWILGVDYSPDGKDIAVAYRSGKVVVIDSENGHLAYSLQEENKTSPLFGVRYSPDGTTVAAYTDKAIQRWAADGTPLRPLSDHDVVGFAFNRDGKIASANMDGSVKIWAEDGRLLTTLPGHEGIGSDIAVNRVAFSPDGKTVASANEGKNVILWNWQADLSLDGTLAEACQWIRDYLANNSKVGGDDRHLCDGIMRRQG